LLLSAVQAGRINRQWQVPAHSSNGTAARCSAANADNTTAELTELADSLNSAFSALTLLVGWHEGRMACKKLSLWGAVMVICLEQGADLYIVQPMPLSLVSVKSRLVLPSW